jgi:hypothetical protein
MIGTDSLDLSQKIPKLQKLLCMPYRIALDPTRVL